MTRRTTIAAGVAAAAIATAVAVPAIAASTSEPPRVQTRASVAGQRYFVDAGDLRERFDARIDSAVADGWITPKLAAKLKEHLVVAESLVRPNLRRFEDRLLAPAAKALNTTPQELRAELRSGMTPAEIARAHGKTPDALVAQLVERLDQRLGKAVGKGRLSQQPADAIVDRLEQRVSAWLERLLAGGS